MLVFLMTLEGIIIIIHLHLWDQKPIFAGGSSCLWIRDMLGIVILLNFDRLDVFVGYWFHLNLLHQIQILFIGIRRRLFWLKTLHACGFDFTEVLSALVVQHLIYFWAIRLTRMMKGW